jgi:CDP-diacylglycerol--glycerol-3-phosphate 3-phosphatidyltransferase
MLENLKPFYSTILKPLAWILIKFKIHPNVITLTGACISPIAAWYIVQGKWFIAALLISVGGFMDGLDGLVARTTGTRSRIGAILDSTSDRITEIIWLFGVILFYCSKPNGNPAICLTFAAMSGSLMVSYVRARCEGAGVPCSVGISQRPERIVILIICLLCGPKVMVWGILLLAVLSYTTVVQRLVAAFTFCKKNKS